MSMQDQSGQSAQQQSGSQQSGTSEQAGTSGQSLHDLAAEDQPVVTDAQGVAGLDADEEPRGADSAYWDDPSTVAPGSPGRPLGGGPREQTVTGGADEGPDAD